MWGGDLMTFNQRLKELRNENNLTQLQLAKMINLSKSNISKYEAGFIEPNLETVKLIAKIFSVSADDLLEVEKTNLQGQPLTDKQQKIAIASKGLLPDEIEKVIEYVEFVKAKRK